MLGNSPFYYNITRKYIVAIASIFSNVQVQRFDANGTAVKTITAPVTYAGKDKLHNYLLHDKHNQVSTVLPRIGFMLTGMAYDPIRKTSNYNEISVNADDVSEWFMFYSNPYTFNFSLSAIAKNFDDLLQMTEQISAFFTPDYSVTINEIPELGIKRDIQINLDSISFNIESEYGEDFSDRIVMADFDLTLQGWVYPPVKDSKIITLINTNFKDIDTSAHYATVQHQWDSINEEIDTTITES